jgi:hypothetical protein
MFIYSFKASTLRFFAVLLLAATALVALIVFVPTYDSTASEAGVSISYDNIKTNEDRIKFLGQFGYNVSSEPIESVEVTLPNEFDRVFSGYNELQKAQGLDLSKYKNKQVMRYTYEVTNYPSTPDAKVWANVIVWRGKVIGGDICSADPSGFIHGFERAGE